MLGCQAYTDLKSPVFLQSSPTFPSVKDAKVIGLYLQSLPQPTFCPLNNTRTVELTFDNSSFVLSLTPTHISGASLSHSITLLQVYCPHPTFTEHSSYYSAGEQGVLLLSSSRDEKCHAISHCLPPSTIYTCTKSSPHHTLLFRLIDSG